MNMSRSDADFRPNEISMEPSIGASAVLALGSYGSGLTPLTGVIRLLGADVPTDGGLPALTKVHDALGHAGCTGWDDWRAVAGTLQSAPATGRLSVEALDALRMNFGASRLFVLRDPRICRSLPFWRAAIAAFGARALAVVMVRHPLDVMDSLRRHYGCAPPTSYLLWLRYVLDAENASRDMPRAIVTCDRLLSDWSGTILRLQTELGVRWPRRSALVDLEIEQFLREPIQRQEAHPSEVAPEAKDWLLETYDALAQLSLNPNCTEGFVRLDRIRSELNRAFAIFRPLLHDPEVELASWRNRKPYNDKDVKDADESVRQLYDELRASELFDWHWYLQTYLDVRDRRSDPLLHYLQFGVPEARDPNPLFDTDWYLEQNADVQGVGLNPLAHYLRHGAAEGRDPSPLFDTAWYIQQYPDVTAMALNPLAHYLKYGRAQGRLPRPPN
jgi:hypothetical protein